MNLKLFAAIFFLLLGFVLYFTGKPKLSKEYEALRTAEVWQRKTTPDEWVLVTGKILPRTDTTWQDLIVANHERFTGTGKLNGWKADKTFLRPFAVQTEGARVMVSLSEVPDRGEQLTVIPLEERTERNRRIRLKGLKAGSTLTVVGRYSMEKQQVEGVYAYAGTVAAYQRLLEAGGKVIHQIVAVVGGIGLVFLLWHFISKKKTKRVTPNA